MRQQIEINLVAGSELPGRKHAERRKQEELEQAKQFITRTNSENADSQDGRKQCGHAGDLAEKQRGDAIRTAVAASKSIGSEA